MRVGSAANTKTTRQSNQIAADILILGDSISGLQACEIVESLVSRCLMVKRIRPKIWLADVCNLDHWKPHFQYQALLNICRTFVCVCLFLEIALFVLGSFSKKRPDINLKAHKTLSRTQPHSNKMSGARSGGGGLRCGCVCKRWCVAAMHQCGTPETPDANVMHAV